MNKIDKIKKKVKAYNNYASKHGYNVISVDFENKIVDGSLILKNEKQYNGFIGIFKNLKTAYHNGYLEEDYKEIVKLVKNL